MLDLLGGVVFVMVVLSCSGGIIALKLRHGRWPEKRRGGGEELIEGMGKKGKKLLRSNDHMQWKSCDDSL